jgi:hypothetical protein
MGMDAQAAASKFVGNFQTQAQVTSPVKRVKGSELSKKDTELSLHTKKDRECEQRSDLRVSNISTSPLDKSSTLTAAENISELKWPAPVLHHARRRQAVTAMKMRTPQSPDPVPRTASITRTPSDKKIEMRTSSDTSNASTIISGQSFDQTQTGGQIQSVETGSSASSSAHLSVGPNTARTLDISQLSTLPEVGEFYLL